MQSPVAVATLKQLKDGRTRDGLVAMLIALFAVGVLWSAIASTF